jgi:murein DD-endopeptidase MepM/ murein hydrolase activator NlpD
MRGAFPAFRLCAVAPMLLAGLLPLEADVQSRWTWAGAWYYPVGDSFAIGGIPPAGWQVTRNVKDGGHQGADLSFRRGGDPVRAAANGIVLLAGTGEDPGGFGVHVVVAHRADDGRLCYSVYAHLARGSVRVDPGDAVAAGQRIGQVGATGRATSPHLHFEIRLPASPDQRWEKAAVVDPIAFVAARLPGSRTDTTWARPYRLWAETAGVLAAGERADDRLDQGEWWCALAAALTLEDSALARSPLAARDQLAKAGIQLSAHPDEVSKPAEWDDVFTDLAQVPVHLWRLPFAPTPPEESTRDRADHLPMNQGSRPDMRPAPPSRADICLLLADRAADPPKP